jgi:hypothetical protein
MKGTFMADPDGTIWFETLCGVGPVAGAQKSGWIWTQARVQRFAVAPVVSRCGQNDFPRANSQTIRTGIFSLL